MPMLLLPTMWAQDCDSGIMILPPLSGNGQMHFLFLFLSGVTAAGPQNGAELDVGSKPSPKGPGWLGRGVVDHQIIQLIEKAISRAEGRLPPDVLWQPRNFGAIDYEGGHRVTFVHDDLSAVSTSSDILQALQQLALLADKEAGWNLTSNGIGDRLQIRCAEAIEYSEADTQTTEYAERLSWHNDGETLITLAVPLSVLGSEFEGGEVEVLRRSESFGSSSWHAKAGRSDALAWRGWDDHRVHPVTRGRRRVVVVEWWLGASVSQNGTRLDDVESDEISTHLLSLDPDSLELQFRAAKSLGRRGQIAEAGAAIRRVWQLDPGWERARGEYADELMRQSKFKEAENVLQAALTINPSSFRAHKSSLASGRQRDIPLNRKNPT